MTPVEARLEQFTRPQALVFVVAFPQKNHRGPAVADGSDHGRGPQIEPGHRVTTCHWSSWKDVDWVDILRVGGDSTNRTAGEVHSEEIDVALFHGRTNVRDLLAAARGTLAFADGQHIGNRSEDQLVPF
ncbi:hypothetical protein IFM61392_09190 [Aspergillus lentulus]|uniref:Uncharacterized protein n=1 Tax=Aspergillus lentulus TaxID=293939 RepID=A0ABQ1B326_ASPLE|nr:hypothetical protein IFM60648_09884 [Aspergillus lentulus]GFG15841.1 hypothetical protein IFM61392_09190 [Aspergillus lentulus]